MTAQQTLSGLREANETSKASPRELRTFEIRIYFGVSYFEKHERECEDEQDARYEAEDIIATLYYENRHKVLKYTIDEITD